MFRQLRIVALAVLVALGSLLPAVAQQSKPAGGKTQITNSIGMKLVLVPAGEFLMGAPNSEKGSDIDERPQHRVRITQAFYMSMYEVTQAEYEQVMGTNPSWFSVKGGGKEKVAGLDTRRFPVENVSWDDAMGFCRRLSQREGRKYRLPREAQWEYACRAGTTTPFSSGNTLTGNGANFNGNYPYGTQQKGPYLERPTTVGAYRPNAFGLYDMQGNVWEWCQDLYGFDYYRDSPTDDPPGPSMGWSRTYRGGGWNSYASGCRSAYRGHAVPVDRFNYVGFRVRVAD